MDLVRYIIPIIIIVCAGCTSEKSNVAITNELFEQIFEQDSSVLFKPYTKFIYRKLIVINSSNDTISDTIDISQLKVFKEQIGLGSFDMIESRNAELDFYEFFVRFIDNEIHVLRDFSYPCAEELCLVGRTYFFEKEDDRFILKRYLNTAET